MQIAFARQSAGTGAHQEYSGERLLNMYARPFPDGGVGPFIIASSPGLTPWVTLAAGEPVRAVLEVKGVVYASCNSRLWRVSSLGVATDLGPVADDPLTTIASNGIDVAVAAGGAYHVWNGTSLTVVDVGVFSDTASVAALNNYIIITQSGGQRFAVSGLLDASTVDPLDFASAEGSPDNIIRGHSDHGELWFFGTRSTEIWGNSGGADFPFSRFSGGFLQRGCAFAGSIVSEDNGVFFVGDDRVVYRVSVGGAPQRVSTQWVDEVLQGYANTAEISAFSFTQDGAKVYALRLPDRPALLFDIASQRWHERSTGLDDGPWIATCGTRLGERQVIGATDGKLHTLGGLTDGGEIIMREGVSLPVSTARQRMSVSMVQLNFKTGATDIGRDAQVMLQCSRDGRTWGVERWRPLGAAGEYDRLVRWRAWGQSRLFQWRFRITDPIDTALYGASME